MKRILFVVKNMNVGGVEKSLLSLLKTINQSDNEVDLLLLERFGGFMDAIPQWVNVFVYDEYEIIAEEVNLPPLQVIYHHLKNRRIKRAIQLGSGFIRSKLSGNSIHYLNSVFKSFPELKKKYDVAVAYSSMISYLTYIVDFKVNADKRIGWIHFDVSKLSFDKKLIYELHKKMEKVYVVSKDALLEFSKSFPELKDKCEVRYNVIDRKEIVRLAGEPVESIRSDGYVTIVTLGRLSTEKGQDIIPKVASVLKKADVDFRWYLIGDGNLRNRIEQLSFELGVESNVVLLGTKTNPYPYMKQADIYVQTSVYEGHCVSILEAIVFGMTIITTEFAGVREQLEGVENHSVVKREVSELAYAIMKVIK